MPWAIEVPKNWLFLIKLHLAMWLSIALSKVLCATEGGQKLKILEEINY